MRSLALAAALAAAAPAFAAGPSQAELAGLRGVASTFVRTESFTVDEPDAVASVVYGSKAYGYFETTAVASSSRAVTAEFVPPGYREPLSFYLRLKAGGPLRLAGRRVFKNPLPKRLSTLRAEFVHGRFSFNFLLLSGALSDPARPKNESVENYPFIINRYGEVVWVHFLHPEREGFRVNTFLSGKRLGPGRFAFLAGSAQTYFEVADWKGRVLASFDGRTAKPPVSLHHDFFERPDGTFLAPSRHFQYFRHPTDPKLSHEPLSTDTLTVIDPSSGTDRVVWDSVKDYDPAARADVWVRGDPSRTFSRWDLPVAYDTLHVNAIDHVPGRGYLLSSLNFNRLLMIDEKFEKILWDVAAASATYIVRGAAVPLGRQHSAHMTPAGTILLFNNGDCPSPSSPPNSGIVELKLDDARGAADVIWSFYPKPPIKTCSRSSVYALPNGRLLAFFMLGDMEGVDRRYDMLVEVDHETSAELGRLRIFHNGPGDSRPTNRALPIEAIGPERFLGPVPL